MFQEGSDALEDPRISSELRLESTLRTIVRLMLIYAHWEGYEVSSRGGR
jgi:hypothetical protein